MWPLKEQKVCEQSVRVQFQRKSPTEWKFRSMEICETWQVVKRKGGCTNLVADVTQNSVAVFSKLRA